MRKIYQDIIETVGNTPLVNLNKLTRGLEAEVVVKLEFFNPWGSVKDRIGVSMIKKAEKNHLLRKNSLIIEPTSGNTGIALAAVCAVKGYRLVLVMLEDVSPQKRDLLRTLGAKIIFTPAREGMSGAIRKVQKMLKKNPRYVWLDQFKNPSNPRAHYLTTAKEIWQDTGGKIDIFVCGVGTGGTLTGVARRLKKLNPRLKVVAVEPANSAVLSGGKPGQHKIEGMGAGFIPPLLDKKLIDEVIKITDTQAIRMTQRLIKEEGILGGISSGACVAAALKVARRPSSKDKLILTILADAITRYL